MGLRIVCFSVLLLPSRVGLVRLHPSFTGEELTSSPTGRIEPCPDLRIPKYCRDKQRTRCQGYVLEQMNKADDRYHTIYRIMFPISYRYVESRSCRLETPHYRYIPHDKSKRGARSCQEWETDQGHYQESGVGPDRCLARLCISCKLSVEYSMQVGDRSIL